MQKAIVALKAHGNYISSCNLYWLDMWKNPAPGVPLAQHRVQQLANFCFPEHRTNNYFKQRLKVQVDVCGLTTTPLGLVAISPLEIVHAMLRKAAEDLGKDSVTDACKEAWKRALFLGHYLILMPKLSFNPTCCSCSVASRTHNKDSCVVSGLPCLSR